MLKRCLIPIGGALALLASVIAPVSALDCQKASSSIEKAICSDRGLRDANERFNKGYVRLGELLDRVQRQELITEQRGWLKERDAACTGKSADALIACVRDATDKRMRALARRYGDGYRFDKVTLGRAGATLMVGGERLELRTARDDVQRDVPVLQLVHGNTLIAESLQPFTIDARAGDENGEAVVVSDHDGGNLGCSHQIVVSARRNGPLRVEWLSPQDDVCPRHYDVSRRADMLEFTLRASPGQDGVVKRWSVSSGRLFLEKPHLEFAPKRGTTMAAFDEKAPPTDNEELFNALKRAAPRDWRAMARALEHAVVRSADDAAIVLAPCSDGSRFCPGENAFAAYAMARKTFYFAYAVPGRSPAEIRYYPARETWPAGMSEIVGQWVNGEMRDRP